MVAANGPMQVQQQAVQQQQQQPPPQQQPQPLQRQLKPPRPHRATALLVPRAPQARTPVTAQGPLQGSNQQQGQVWSAEVRGEVKTITFEGENGFRILKVKVCAGA